MHNIRYVILDVETTGLSPRNGDRIIEIGALAIENRIIKEEFHTLINIDQPIPRQAQDIHGITREMLTETIVVTKKQSQRRCSSRVRKSA